MAKYVEDWVAAVRGFEGVIPWMYRDTVGRVTVGVGVMLPDAASAAGLHFEVGGRGATGKEVREEFGRVDGMPAGRPALFYRRSGGPEMPEEAMEAVLREKAGEVEVKLAQKLGGFDALPDGVKMALLDMGYNLGVAGLVGGYPKMLAAVAAGDWRQAAGECFRHGPGAARNEWTAKMLEGNVIAAVGAAGDGMMKTMMFGVIGMVASMMEKEKE